jgi:hypothetical protein
LVKNKGEEYKCNECGLVVLVENPCECGDECEIMCCDQPMKPLKATAKATTQKAPVKSAEKKVEKPKK